MKYYGYADPPYWYAPEYRYASCVPVCLSRTDTLLPYWYACAHIGTHGAYWYALRILILARGDCTSKPLST